MYISISGDKMEELEKIKSSINSMRRKRDEHNSLDVNPAYADVIETAFVNIKEKFESEIKEKYSDNSDISSILKEVGEEVLKLLLRIKEHYLKVEQKHELKLEAIDEVIQEMMSEYVKRADKLKKENQDNLPERKAPESLKTKRNRALSKKKPVESKNS
jgi:ribosome-associated translation inhibitor RaiA